jgi:hypothetical protein
MPEPAMTMQEARIELIALDSSRDAVHEDRQAGNAPVPHELAEVEQHRLGPIDREGGNDDVAAPIDGVVDDLRQGVGDRAGGLVVAIAVRRLHDDVVRLREDRRIMGQGPRPGANVAGEDDPAAATRLADRDLDHRRTQDVAGVVVPDLHALVQVDGLLVGDAPEQPHRGRGVLGPVERRHRIPAPAPLFLVAPLLVCRVLLLDPGGILQHDPGQLHGRRRGQDGAHVAVRHEPRQEPAVVEMGVGQQQMAHVCRGDRRRLPVAVQVLPLLKQAAVDQHTNAAPLQQVP